MAVPTPKRPYLRVLSLARPSARPLRPFGRHHQVRRRQCGGAPVGLLNVVLDIPEPTRQMPAANRWERVDRDLQNVQCGLVGDRLPASLDKVGDAVGKGAEAGSLFSATSGALRSP